MSMPNFKKDKKPMTDFHKAVKKAMVDREITLNDLAFLINEDKNYMFEVIKGSRYSQKITDKLINELNIVIEPKPTSE